MPGCPEILSKGWFKDVLKAQVKRIANRLSKGLESMDLNYPRINGV